MDKKIKILRDTRSVTEFLETVQRAADSDRDALGFLPRKVYSEAVLLGTLYVAVDSLGKYAGHLLFGASFPRGRIYQLYVSPKYRRKGVGARLLQALKAFLIKNGFTSISARVATDLVHANHFWQQTGYRTVRTVLGGSSRKRKINLRILELAIPGLIALMEKPPTDSSSRLPLSIRAYRTSPLYLLDLNIFFDVAKRRQREIFAGRVFRAALQNFVKLVVAKEFVVELERNTQGRDDDIILNFARHLPQLPPPPEDFVQNLLVDLCQTLFPARSQQQKLHARDLSDARHIAAAIYHSAAGFVTAEKAILKCKEYLLAKHGLYCTSPSEFAESIDRIDRPAETLGSFRHSRDNVSTIRVVGSAERVKITQFLRELYLSEAELLRVLPPIPQPEGSMAFGVWSNDEPIAYINWLIQGPGGEVVSVFLSADECAIGVVAAVDALLALCCTHLSRLGPVLIRLSIPAGFTTCREIAASHGFQSGVNPEEPDSSHKLAIGAVIGPKNWTRMSARIRSATGIRLPAKPIEFTGPKQEITLTSEAHEPRPFPINLLENLLSPVLFLFYNRPCVIVPIRPSFARDLFGSGNQMRLFESPHARLLRERVYLSSIRNQNRLAEGSLLFFYESGRGSGSKAIIAVARSTGSLIVSRSDIGSELYEKAVVDERELGLLVSDEQLTATSLDNIMLMPLPVNLKRLKALGAVGPANLVAPQSVSFDNASAILEEGKLYG